nr:interleukin-2 receptor subunit beta-like [Odocoileus virginianus texanus]
MYATAYTRACCRNTHSAPPTPPYPGRPQRRREIFIWPLPSTTWAEGAGARPWGDGCGPSSGEKQRERVAAPCPSQGSLPQPPPVDVMAAPALPCCLSLLILLLPLAIPQASTSVNGLSISSPDGDRSGGQTLEGHGCPTASPTSHIFTAFASNITCFYNSRANVSCIWSHDEGLQATTCCLHSHQPKREELFPTKQWKHTCELQPVKPGSWACNLVLGQSPEKLTVVDVMKLTVMCSEGGKWRKMKTQDIKPFDYIRLVPPHSLQVAHVETHRCNITWTISQVSHYIQNDVEFEARLRYADHSWEDTPLLTLRQNQQWIYLENLAPGMEYELQVRAKPQLGRHEVWSHWSQPLAFRMVPAGTDGELRLAHELPGAREIKVTGLSPMWGRREASGWVCNAPSCPESPLRAEKNLSHNPVASPSPLCTPSQQGSKVPGSDSSNQRMPFLEEFV